MSAEERARAFDRFWQSGEPRRDGRPNGHFGLGLAIVRELVVGDGGDVALEPSPSGGLEVIVRMRRSAGVVAPRPRQLSTRLRHADRVAVDHVGVADAGAVDEVGERVAARGTGGSPRTRRPRPPAGRSGPRSGRARPCSVVSGPSTAARMSASVISLGRPGEHVAAADAALRAHEPGALHREQDLLEVRLGEAVRSAISFTDVGGRSRAARATGARGPRSRPGSRPSSAAHGRTRRHAAPTVLRPGRHA